MVVGLYCFSFSVDATTSVCCLLLFPSITSPCLDHSFPTLHCGCGLTPCSGRGQLHGKGKTFTVILIHRWLNKSQYSLQLYDAVMTLDFIRPAVLLWSLMCGYLISQADCEKAVFSWAKCVLAVNNCMEKTLKSDTSCVKIIKQVL